MSIENTDKLVYGIRLSTVVPGRVTGDGKVRELKGADLAMKLHYIRALYFFTNNNDNNSSSLVSIRDFKNRHLFDWLETYFMTCGRVRVASEEGVPLIRPVIKLNDAGIRIAEANSSKTVQEWLAIDNFDSLNHLLTYNHVLGPDLSFTPLVFLQVTWFRCGGVSVGLSWAHILGDPFAASTFINMLGYYLQGELLPMVLSIPKDSPTSSRPSGRHPLSIKRVNPVGDCWVARPPSNDNKMMSSHSFEVTQQQVAQLHSIIHAGGCCGCCSWFELISGVIWKCIAKIRKIEKEPKVVTICRPSTETSREQVIPYNGQVIGTCTVESVSTTHVSELVSLIGGKVVDESEMISKIVNSNSSSSSSSDDYVVYGGNLTFIDMEEANIYGFQLKGQRPVCATYTVGGIGDEGVVLVLPGPPTQGTSKLITLMLPQSEIQLLKMELQEQCSFIIA